MQSMIGVIVGLVVMVGIFLVARELVLWYWKVNEISKTLAALLDEQKKTNALLQGQSLLSLQKTP